jgi:hypothetical protein
MNEVALMAEFNVRFAVHLGKTQISNLKGILLFKGIAVSGDDLSLVFQVYRPNRVSGVATTLNNWAALGWVDEWSSRPPLSIAEEI